MYGREAYINIDVFYKLYIYIYTPLYVLYVLNLVTKRVRGVRGDSVEKYLQIRYMLLAPGQPMFISITHEN